MQQVPSSVFAYISSLVCMFNVAWCSDVNYVCSKNVQKQWERMHLKSNCSNHTQLLTIKLFAIYRE